MWLCSSSALSVAIVFSGSAAWAEGQPSISNTANPDTFSSTTLKPSLPLPNLADSVASHENPFIPSFGSDSNQFVLNHEAALNTDGTQAVADRSPSDAPEPAALEELNYSAEALIQPAPQFTEAAIEPTEPVFLSPTAQADTPNLEPSEPSGELQPSEPPSERSFESQPSEPQPSEPSATSSSQSWQFSVEPYFFAPLDVNADVTVNGRSSSIELGLDDILEFDRAFDAGLRLRAQNDRLGFILDGFYLYGENSGSLGRTFSSGSIFQFVQRNSPGTLEEFVQRFEPQQIQQFVQIGRQIGLNTPVNVTADGTVSVRQITIDAAVSYRVIDTSLSQSEETDFYPRLAVAPIAGVRTNILQQTIEVDDIRINGRTIPDRVLPPIDRSFRFSKTLVEPLIGAQIDLALSEQWALAFRGDVSGFNIGARQNFTWNVMLGAQYNISRNVVLQLAYRFNGFDFETGEGFRRTELNLRQNGVMLNAIFRF
ncbi:hypothetical protein [Leptolyngbya ohadii]|uniref:hypothetical protein n=1 Tax=Leptolyngbya ohadii TaxID=1962290 RepID=UPI000B59CBDB|nr:hypothetical protein [Leptolyngbya ohadii]